MCRCTYGRGRKENDNKTFLAKWIAGGNDNLIAKTSEGAGTPDY